MRPGDRITVTARVVDLTEKTGSLGNMLFVRMESRYVNQAAEPVASQHGTYIYHRHSDPSKG